MSGKRVDIGLRPGGKKDADGWVTQSSSSDTSSREESSPAIMKRLTIDVPEDLHRQLKVKAATDGVKMADLVRGWIEEGCM
jgi:predicted HicB family RNase H-like nuclease